MLELELAKANRNRVRKGEQETFESSNHTWIDYVVLTVAFFLVVHNLDAPLFLIDNTFYESYALNAGIGSVSKQIGICILFVYGLLAAAFTAKKSFHLEATTKILCLAFGLLITSSVVWSAAPSASVNRLAGFIALALAAMGSVKRLAWGDLVGWYALAHCGYLLLGVGNEILLKTFAPFNSDYRFSGISDPNATGTDAVIVTLSCIVMMRYSIRPWIYKVALVTAVPLLLLTKSRTALLALLVTIAIYYGIVRFRGAVLAAHLLIAITPLAILSYLDSIGSVNLASVISLGRVEAAESTMSGRLPLWTELCETYISKQPLLGYGYGGFWTPRQSAMISADQGWPISAAHSLYIDAALNIGIVGLLLYLSVTMYLLTRSLTASRQGRRSGVFWGFLLMASLLDGVSDSGPWFISSIYLFGCIQAVFIAGVKRTDLKVSESCGRHARVYSATR